MIDLISRLHPVLVHLPIGILLLACFFQLLTLRKNFALLQPAIPVALFWGMISAIASCISGFFLSRSGDYDVQLVSRHQWLGIAVAVVSVIMWLQYRFSLRLSIARASSVILIVLIIITGHLGGSLTHGSGFLTDGFNSDESPKGPAIKPIANVQEASVYADMVQPLLKARCYSCHGPEKQKGKLRLDDPDYILKGGEDGKAVIAGKPGESEMIERLLLPLDNKDHMPPKERRQLTQDEIALLHWWISTGANFNAKVKDLAQDEKIKSVLPVFSGAVTDMENVSGLPEKEVSKASPVILTRLQNLGVIVMPVTQNSNYLSANFVTATSVSDSVLSLLTQLKDQLLWLKLDNAPVNDAAMNHIAQCTTLTRLSISHTPVTDKGLASLQTLSQLQSLNLTGTAVTAEGVMKLQSLKKLKSIYLYRASIDSAAASSLQKSFPGVLIETGNYKVPTLAADTTEVPYPKD